jgi:hypothetical protein
MEEERFDIVYCQPNAPHHKICGRTMEDVIDFFFRGWACTSIHDVIETGNWKLMYEGTNTEVEVE